MDEQAKQVANYLLGLLQEACTIPAREAENVVGAKNFLRAMATGQLVVSEPKAPDTPPPVPPKGNGVDSPDSPDSPPAE